MRTQLISVAACVAAMALDAGCGTADDVGVSDGVPSSTYAIVNGVETGEGFSNVGQMVGRVSSTSPWISLCSGTLIAPTVFLTAGHCPWAARVALRFSETGVHFDPTLTSTTNVITQGVWIQHPSFVNPPSPPFPFPTPANHPDNFDLAVFVMDQPVHRHPAKLPRMNSLSALAGEHPLFTVVGFGVTVIGQPQTAGVRRSTTDRLVDVFDAFLLLGPDPGLACSRDSGGPNFPGGSGHNGKKPFVSTVDATVSNTDCTSFALVYRLDTPQAQTFLSQFLDGEEGEEGEGD